jgi:hypothetical protein
MNLHLNQKGYQLRSELNSQLHQVNLQLNTTMNQLWFELADQRDEFAAKSEGRSISL